MKRKSAGRETKVTPPRSKTSIQFTPPGELNSKHDSEPWAGSFTLLDVLRGGEGSTIKW